jgi:hypothetical protein
VSDTRSLANAVRKVEFHLLHLNSLGENFSFAPTELCHFQTLPTASPWASFLCRFAAEDPSLLLTAKRLRVDQEGYALGVGEAQGFLTRKILFLLHCLRETLDYLHNLAV